MDFCSPYQILSWLWVQPVKLDRGDGPKAEAARRSSDRAWAQRRVANCWEAVAHLWPWPWCISGLIEFHVYDASVHGGRHVFPAVRPLYDVSSLPVPLVIQPAVKTGGYAGAARRPGLGERPLGAVHFVGDKVLRVFGAGELADTLADVEGDALPDWARYREAENSSAQPS